jgi:hypothetical protein
VADKLWKWYRTGGFEAIGYWLKTRDVSKFNPAEPPMMTEFKHNLVENSMSVAESYIVDLMRRRERLFARGVIGSPFHTLCSDLAATAPSGVKVPQAALFHALKEAGWVDMGRLSSSDFTTRKQIFCAPDMVTTSKSNLRRMVEPNGMDSKNFISVVK